MEAQAGEGAGGSIEGSIRSFKGGVLETERVIVLLVKGVFTWPQEPEKGNDQQVGNCVVENRVCGHQVLAGMLDQGHWNRFCLFHWWVLLGMGTLDVGEVHVHDMVEGFAGV